MRRVEIILDLETTGLHADAEIISLAALERSTGKSFYKDAQPKRMPISKNITRITGITNARLRRKPPWSMVGVAFWDWVATFCNEKVTVALIAHNARRFDVPLLLRRSASLKRASPVDMRALLVKDTLVVARHLLPGLRPNHRQASVYAHLFGEEPLLQHNAMGDVDALRKIMDHDLFTATPAEICTYNALDVHTTDVRRCANVIRLHADSKLDMRAFFGAVTCANVSDQGSEHAPLGDPSAACSAICVRCNHVYSVFFNHECVRVTRQSTPTRPRVDDAV